MAKAIHYNLYRFGMDEFAIGHLINGDFPDDDEERWQMVDAPRYHIRRMVDEHTRAQQALRDCRDSGHPFVLYLRSFSSELRGERVEGAIYGERVQRLGEDPGERQSTRMGRRQLPVRHRALPRTCSRGPISI